MGLDDTALVHRAGTALLLRPGGAEKRCIREGDTNQ